jgi:hypothetical protein
MISTGRDDDFADGDFRRAGWISGQGISIPAVAAFRQGLEFVGFISGVCKLQKACAKAKTNADY